jgi:hypothetical protein
MMKTLRDILTALRTPLLVAMVTAMCASAVMAQRGGEATEDTPESPAIGPQRILEPQTFVGRFGKGYTNWGERDYPRLVGVTSNLRNIYSVLGDPLVYGSESITWAERRGLGVQRFRTGTSLDESIAHGESGASFSRLFNYVVVGTDGTDAWQSRIIYANEIRTRLTPLTFKMSNLNGLRLDVGTKYDGFSMMFSRLHAPIWQSNFGGDTAVKAKALLFGMHYERKVGFMNFGTTFVNAHQYEPLMQESALSLKGVPGAMQGATALMAIRISDDSPTDGQGPTLHDVTVIVNGIERPDLEPFLVMQTKRGDERQSYVAGLLRSGERRPLPPLANDYQSINRGSSYNTYDAYIDYAAFDVDVYYRGYEFPYWIDHLYYNDYKVNGPDYVINPGHDELENDIIVGEEFAYELVESSGDFGYAGTGDLPQTLDGNTYGILYVDLEPVGETIESVNVDLALSGDYRVELSELDMAGNSSTGARDNYRDKYRYASYFRTVARADGNPGGGRVHRVRVKSGVPTGLNIASANMYGVYKGWQINGEVSRSSSFHQYASGSPTPRVALENISLNALAREEARGARSQINDIAYYVTAERDFNRFGVGAEVFAVGPLYETELRTYIGRDEVDLNGRPVAYNNTMIHRLVEDNDDDDRYPDSWYENAPSDLQGQSDVDGIFPGLDEDSDGIPDTNKDFDAVPDHQEPFLMYSSDPQIYDFGIDFNHNNFIDARENDIYADLPYDRDLSGIHGYGSFHLLQGLELTLGTMRGEQMAGSAPNNSTYARLELHKQKLSVGRFFAHAAVERVEDAVRDSLSIYSDRVLTVSEQFELDFAGLQRNLQIAPFLEEPLGDDLLFQNSNWYRLYVDAEWMSIPGLSMRNKVKFEVNDQRSGELWDGSEQEGEQLNRWTMVHTLDYRWQLASKWTLFTGYKMRYRKEWLGSESRATVHERHSIPLSKLEYRLTDRTRFQLGLQGFGSWLPYRISDLVNPEIDFEQNDTVLMLTNNSNYFGYVLTTTMGMSKRKKEFSDPQRAIIGNEDFVSAFIKVYVGFADE